MHTLFPIDVVLKEDTHQYFHKDGREFTSVSKIIAGIAEEFDEENIATHTARARGVTKEAILAEWAKTRDDATAHGTRIHNALEFYAKSGTVHTADEHLRPVVISVMQKYVDYYQCHNEVCLYDEDREIAGTADKINIVKRGKSGWVDISDFKTNVSKGIQFYNKYGKTLLPPFNHLQDCNYVKYSFQLSIYAYMFEKLTSYKIRKLYIDFIPPLDLMQHKEIPVLYLKPEVELLFSKIPAKNLMPAF